MPRRRAVRLLGGAVLAAVLPNPFVERAHGAGGQFPTQTAGCACPKCPTCAKQFGPKISECCGKIFPNDPHSNSWCCEPGGCLRDPRTGKGGQCCFPSRGESKCGETCCGPDRECVDLTVGGRSRKTCVFRCAAGERRCGRPLTPSNLDCCPDGKCCGTSCCSGDQVCVTGLNADGNPFKLCKSKCQNGLVRCNFVCCKRADRAYKKLPNGRVKCVCAPG